MGVPRWSPHEVQALVAQGGAVLVDLRADWCSRCGPQEAVLGRLLPEYAGRVSIGTVDVSAHPSLADDHGIKSLPAFLFFAGGNHRLTVNGYRRAPELREILSRLLASATTT